MKTSCSLSLSLAALCSPLSYAVDEYEGDGKVHILSDGRVIIEHTDPEQDGTALVIEDGDKHSLISDGTTATLLPPWESTPPGTTTSIKLNGDGASAVGGFSGTVKLVETATDEWSLEVYDASVLVFEYEFSGPNQYLQSSGCNVPDACNGGCACSSCLICWCWCDIFGNPNCLCIIPLGPAVIDSM